eukprot:scaffold1486_cov208-Chaetoceros_neogracile.AAC.6
MGRHVIRLGSRAGRGFFVKKKQKQQDERMKITILEQQCDADLRAESNSKDCNKCKLPLGRWIKGRGYEVQSKYLYYSIPPP